MNGEKFVTDGRVWTRRAVASGLLAAATVGRPRRASATLTPTFPKGVWTQKTPAELGMDRSYLVALRNATGNGTGIVVRHGYSVYRWGQDVAVKVDWASAAKPVVSTLLLFALQEGRIDSVDDLIGAWGWPLKSKDRTMTFRHLSCMVSGYALPERPGEAWGYNDYAISLYKKTIFDRVFAQPANTVALDPLRLGPLRFQDGDLFGPQRQGYGLLTSPRDFARIGVFWLNKGNWRGTQLLPSEYFDEYCTNQVSADLPRTKGGLNDYLHVGTDGGTSNQASQAQGFYGFNWWFNTDGATWPDAPPDTFQARGHANAETMVVMPSLGIVAAWYGRQSLPGDPALQDANYYFSLLANSVVDDPTA